MAGVYPGIVKHVAHQALHREPRQLLSHVCTQFHSTAKHSTSTAHHEPTNLLLAQLSLVADVLEL